LKKRHWNDRPRIGSNQCGKRQEKAMTTIVRYTSVLAAMLLAGALGGCEKSSSGGARLDSPNTGAGNSATGATGGTATSQGGSAGTGPAAGNSTAATPGTSTGSTAPSQPAEQAKPKDTPPPY
jgi:hypothetical protein